MPGPEVAVGALALLAVVAVFWIRVAYFERQAQEKLRAEQEIREKRKRELFGDK